MKEPRKQRVAEPSQLPRAVQRGSTGKHRESGDCHRTSELATRGRHANSKPTRVHRTTGSALIATMRVPSSPHCAPRRPHQHSRSPGDRRWRDTPPQKPTSSPCSASVLRLYAGNCLSPSQQAAYQMGYSASAGGRLLGSMTVLAKLSITVRDFPEGPRTPTSLGIGHMDRF